MPRTATTTPAQWTPCPFCDKQFASPNSVYNHVRTKHPGKKFTLSMSKQLMAQNAHTPKTCIAITDLDKELKDIALQLANGEIDIDEFQKLQKGVAEKKKIAQKAWIKTMTYSASPTLDFRIFEVDEELDRWVGERFNELLPLVKKSQHDKVFQRVFINNLKIEPDGCDPLDLDILLYKITYLKEGQEIVEGKLTIEQIWEWYNKIIMSLYRLVVFPDQIGYLDWNNEMKADARVDNEDERNKLLYFLGDLQRPSENAQIVGKLVEVLPRFNQCLKT